MSSRDRFEVTGPGEEGKRYEELGPAVSYAGTVATRARREVEELSVYVRELGGDRVRAVVTKEPGERGAIVTRVVAGWEAEALELV